MSAAELASGVTGALAVFNEAGVLDAADVHVARRLDRLGSGADERVTLAAALAVRAPRMGHVFVDLERARELVAVDAEETVDVGALPWPAADTWREAVAASPLVAVGDDDDAGVRPLRLVGDALYLDRYWREERQLAFDLLALAGDEPAGVDEAVLSAGLARLRREGDETQRLAAASVVLRRLSVIAGGPGTGKTTSVARAVALLLEQPGVVPRIALAAPTGKAAQRLGEAVREEALSLDVAHEVRSSLLDLQGVTLHRLLGWRRGSHSRFRHDRTNRLPHDVVVVDESSMVSLTLMSRLVEAVRPDARLVLVGDPGQLTSIEAGAVLGDVAGPAAAGPRMRAAARARLSRVTGLAVEGSVAPDDVAIGDGITTLDRRHRYGEAIDRVARAVRAGDADETVAALREGGDEIVWIETDAAAPLADLEVVRTGVVAAAREVTTAALAGDAKAAIEALGTFRLLCAHRRGPYGVASWTARIEGWLRAAGGPVTPDGPWYIGRPLLVTENDYGLRLFNGDTGVVVAGPNGDPVATFARGDELLSYAPTRLGAVETVYAMTIHKSQGSQFGTAAIVLPEADSPILSRDLLYTGITRAHDRLVVAGPGPAVRGGVARAAARASSLGRRLWHDAPPVRDPRVRSRGGERLLPYE